MKQLYIDAIVGAGFCGDWERTRHYESVGLARFTGNQWNEEWSWDRSALERLDESTLRQIYEEMRGAL